MLHVFIFVIVEGRRRCDGCQLLLARTAYRSHQKGACPAQREARRHQPSTTTPSNPHPHPIPPITHQGKRG